MAGVKITKRTIDSIVPDGKERFIWDKDIPGFGIRIRESGALTYVCQYRGGFGRGAPTRRLTLFPVGSVTPDEARKIAKEKLGQAATGQDPAAAKSEDRKSLTVSDLADVFLKEHVTAKRKAGTEDSYQRIIENHIKPELGTEKAGKVRRADIAKLHLKMSDTPYQANRMIAVMGSLYAFAGRRGLVPENFNPARGIDRYSEEGRERFLTTEELGRLGDAIREAETVGIEWEVDAERAARPTAKHTPKQPENRRSRIAPHAAAALRLLILTGARLREILHLEWRHIDFERGLLLLPDSKTGKKAIVLNNPAIALLTDLPRLGKYVIAGESAGEVDEKPRSDLKRPWELISKRAGLEGVRLHDLRHTNASFGAAAGLGLPIIGKLLGHTQSATTQRYAHFDNDPLRKASERIGTDLWHAMGEAPARPSADVVPMRLDRGA